MLLPRFEEPAVARHLPVLAEDSVDLVAVAVHVVRLGKIPRAAPGGRTESQTSPNRSTNPRLQAVPGRHQPLNAPGRNRPARIHAGLRVVVHHPGTHANRVGRHRPRLVRVAVERLVEERPLSESLPPSGRRCRSERNPSLPRPLRVRDADGIAHCPLSRLPRFVGFLKDHQSWIVLPSPDAICLDRGTERHLEDAVVLDLPCVVVGDPVVDHDGDPSPIGGRF